VRILLLNSEDHPLSGPWARETWDRVVDPLQGGENAYRAWSDSLGCGVESLGAVDLHDYQRVRRVLEAGCGRLIDTLGLDWWELISIGFDQQIGRVLVLERFAESLQEDDKVFATRRGFHVNVLEHLLGKEIRCFSSGTPSLRQRSRHYWSLPRKFSVSQLSGIFWDKYDSDYRIRGRLSFRRKTRGQPVVLLPSAYVNVSRMGIRYAEMLPDTEFLLVTTRSSGWMELLPENAKAERLAAYASGALAAHQECEELLQKWDRLRADFGSARELAILDRLGLFASFPKQLRAGLGIRNAWLQVFEAEAVESVLCCDDTNAYTRIPLLLARQRVLPTLTCHHGALDAGYLIKKNHADVVLAKGRMEHDYLTRVCGLREDQVEIRGPAQSVSPAPQRTGKARRLWIVFFSEPYEIVGGRTDEFYRDLLPPLANLAEETGRELVIKLHPMESARERRRLVKKIEPVRHRNIRVVSGLLSEELLQQTWFAITVLSTAAVDCALRGVPVFLCSWLEYFSCGYSEQFCRFGAGLKLNSAADVAGIPQMIDRTQWRVAERSDLSTPIADERLRELLSAGAAMRRAVGV
jgi:hypothetical protein